MKRGGLYTLNEAGSKGTCVVVCICDICLDVPTRWRTVEHDDREKTPLPNGTPCILLGTVDDDDSSYAVIYVAGRIGWVFSYELEEI